MKKAILVSFLASFCWPTLAQTWQATGAIGNGNQKVKVLALDNTKILAGTHSAGVHTSTNNGISWQAANTGITNLDVTALLVNSSVYFAGTNGGGVFMSNNSGSSWTAVNTGLSDPFITALTAIGSTIVAGTMNSGVFISTNSGSTWTQPTSTGLTNPQIRSLHHVSGTVLLAGTNGPMGIYRSTDFGANWTLAAGTVTNSYVLSFINFNGAVHAGTGCCALKSIDGGVTWSVTNTTLGSSFYGFTSSGNNLYAALHTNYGAYVSTNSGLTFSVVGTNLGNLDLFSITMLGTDLYVGTDGSGVWKLGTAPGTITAVAEAKETLESTLIYPNPSSGNFYIKSALTLKVHLTNMIGQCIYSAVIQTNKEIEIGNNLPSGVYNLKIDNGKNMEYRKLVVD